jgi:putative ABC transport system ATP-binding protein
VAKDLVIDAQNITKTYGSGASEFTALKNVTFQVERGESVAIVGKSGSGKSTLMHLIALLDKPDSGSLSINGTNAATLKAKALNQFRNKTFGFVFQQFFLTPNTSLLDNVVLPLKIAGIGRSERKRRGIEMLTKFELESKAANKATALSGGQKQRAVIARALINEPAVIFADEPTGNLDSATGGVVEDTLFALNKESGITLVIVTHDEELASRCDRQVYLKDGAIVDSTSASNRKA